MVNYESQNLVLGHSPTTIQSQVKLHHGKQINSGELSKANGA
jgi:hypothetical protein